MEWITTSINKIKHNPIILNEVILWIHTNNNVVHTFNLYLSIKTVSNYLWKCRYYNSGVCNSYNMTVLTLSSQIVLALPFSLARKVYKLGRLQLSSTVKLLLTVTVGMGAVTDNIIQ